MSSQPQLRHSSCLISSHEVALLHGVLAAAPKCASSAVWPFPGCVPLSVSLQHIMRSVTSLMPCVVSQRLSLGKPRLLEMKRSQQRLCCAILLWKNATVTRGHLKDERKCVFRQTTTVKYT